MSSARPALSTRATACPDPSVPGRQVPAVDRAIRLVDELAHRRKPATLADLARTLALPKSSVHGLLNTLLRWGLVTRTDDQAFSLGPRPLQWAQHYGAQTDVVAAFHALAGQSRALAAETVMLAMLDGADVVYLACRPGTRALAVNFRVGGRFPACCTSSGKAMLATLPDAAVRERLGGAGLRRQTRHSVASPAALLRQLATVRAHGWAADDEEMAEGMYCIGAPVFAAGQPCAVAAVAVSLIKAGLTPRHRRELVHAIVQLSDDLTRRLGGQRPSAG